MAGEKAQLTGAKETLLITLYGKALESRLPDSLLKDRFADEAVRKIDYDFSRLKVDENLGVGLAIRARQMDDWVNAFLVRHPQAVVVHIGCGLDTRFFRIDPPAGVQWFDVDYPEVIDLRHRLYPARAGYHLVAASVTDPDWLEQIPRGPALVVAEGLTPYLTAEEGLALLNRLVAHLETGELVCEVYSDLGLKMVGASPMVKATGAELHWAINDPHELERAVPGLVLVDDLPAYKPEHARRMKGPGKVLLYVWRFVPFLRRVGRLLRYRF